MICLISFSKFYLDAILLSRDASEIVNNFPLPPSQYNVNFEFNSARVLLMNSA